MISPRSLSSSIASMQKRTRESDAYSHDMLLIGKCGRTLPICDCPCQAAASKIEMEFKVQLNVKAQTIAGRIYALARRLNLTSGRDVKTGSPSQPLHENNVIPRAREEETHARPPLPDKTRRVIYSRTIVGRYRDVASVYPPSLSRSSLPADNERITGASNISETKLRERISVSLSLICRFGTQRTHTGHTRAQRRSACTRFCARNTRAREEHVHCAAVHV